MRQKTLCEIGGVKYMAPKAAADLWNMNTQAITAACMDGRVAGAIKDSSNHYIIPINAKAPLQRETIRTVLISLLAMKNRPGEIPNDLLNTHQLDAKALFDYLRSTGYLEGNSLMNSVLTNKAMELATSGNSINVDWLNAGITILNVIGSLASIWGALH